MSEIHSFLLDCLQCHKQMVFFCVYTVYTVGGKNNRTVSCLATHRLDAIRHAHSHQPSWVSETLSLSCLWYRQMTTAALCSRCLSVIVVVVAFMTFSFLYLTKHCYGFYNSTGFKRSHKVKQLHWHSIRRFTWVGGSSEVGGHLVHLHSQAKTAFVGGAVSHHKCPCILILYQSFS